MTLPGIRSLALLSALAAAFALGMAIASERWGGLVPCALCLLERWPYRVAIALGLVASVVPPRWARMLLVLVVLSMLVSMALAVIHVGVEQHYWASPLPECAAPRLRRRFDRRAPRADAHATGETVRGPNLPDPEACRFPRRRMEPAVCAGACKVLLAIFLWRDRSVA